MLHKEIIDKIGRKEYMNLLRLFGSLNRLEEEGINSVNSSIVIELMCIYKDFGDIDLDELNIFSIISSEEKDKKYDNYSLEKLLTKLPSSNIPVLKYLTACVIREIDRFFKGTYKPITVDMIHNLSNPYLSELAKYEKIELNSINDCHDLVMLINPYNIVGLALPNYTGTEEDKKYWPFNGNSLTELIMKNLDTYDFSINKLKKLKLLTTGEHIFYKNLTVIQAIGMQVLLSLIRYKWEAWGVKR